MAGNNRYCRPLHVGATAACYDRRNPTFTRRTMMTLYELLGVREDATDEEIKRGYRKAAMKAHPDRNVGREASAHAWFQEVKEAYAILSDPAQRRVYDTVYAEEMLRHARVREEEERLQAEREAEYARFVALAMRFAEAGHNRDVVFGVLLGRDCDVQVAERIAGSVIALHVSRQPGAFRDAQNDEPMPQDDERAAPAASAQDARQPDEMPQSAAEPSPKDDARKSDGRGHADFFSALWHSAFGLRQ
jgi:curved DNA-binding protein CbpA